MDHYTKYKLRVAAGGAATAVIGIGSVLIVGYISQLQALDLLRTMLPTTRFLCSAVMTGTASILALMVTLLSLSRTSETDFKALHYRRIRRIAFVDSLAFVGALLLLLFIMIPMEESEVIPLEWYRFVYYGVLAAAAILGGMVVSVVMMLYTETKQLIGALALDESPPLVHDDDESGDEGSA